MLLFFLRVVANIPHDAIDSEDRSHLFKLEIKVAHSCSQRNYFVILQQKKWPKFSERRKTRLCELQTERSPKTIPPDGSILCIRRGSQSRPHPQTGALLEASFMRLSSFYPDLLDLVFDLLNVVLVSSSFVVRNL
mmetsp:Transcript_3436/g.9110  ORF Transcript_3436/g.9110 Transcript_3436/m.9110 type:complete len:135 (+) Transcript_3436:36-440(+)